MTVSTIVTTICRICGEDDPAEFMPSEARNMPYSRCRNCFRERTPHANFSPAQRRFIYDRANGVCEACGKPLGGFRTNWHADHIVSVTNGGAHHVDNGQALHYDCHRLKCRREGRKILRIVRARVSDLRSGHRP